MPNYDLEERTAEFGEDIKENLILDFTGLELTETNNERGKIYDKSK